MTILIALFLVLLFIFVTEKITKLSRMPDSSLKKQMNDITETYLADNSIQEFIYQNTLEKSPEIEFDSIYKHKFKEPLVVMLRSGNLAIVDNYDGGYKQPLSGTIGEMNGRDMRWTWSLMGKGGDLEENHYDIIAKIGELE